MAGILIVDDELTNRRIARAMLERDAHKVWEAATANETFEVLEKTAVPDLAIVDLRLASESGVEVLRRLRADAIFGSLPVLFCSGLPDRNAVMEAAQLGVVGFMTKPLDPIRLRTGVAKALMNPWMRTHFEDPTTVCRRMSTDRGQYRDLAARFFRGLAATVAMELETPDEKAAARRSITELHQSASDLGLLLLISSLADWVKADADPAPPALLRRSATINRLFNAYIA